MLHVERELIMVAQLSQEPRPDALNPEPSQPQQEQPSSQATELAEPVIPETTVPEDPSTRKLFIQEVRTTHHTLPPLPNQEV